MPRKRKNSSSTKENEEVVTECSQDSVLPRKSRRTRSSLTPANHISTDPPSKQSSKTDTSKQSTKTDTSKQSSKTDTSKQSSKTDTSKQSSKTDTSKQSSKTDTSKQSSKTDTSKQSSKTDTSKQSSKTSSSKQSKTRGKSSAKCDSAGKSASCGVAQAESTVKTVVVKGCAPVDPECTSKVGCAHVYAFGKDIYDVMLNQTNVTMNNNKFFLIQLLEDDARKAFSVWFHWGRVGYKGQNNLIPCGSDLEQAKNIFIKKFEDKTKNMWSERKKFKKVHNKYDLVKIDYGTKDLVPLQKKQAKSSNVPSKLSANIQALIQLICDVKAMTEMVVEMKYDAERAPLGKLTPIQIKGGYAALNKIDTCIQMGNFGSAFKDACSEFYTRVPHYFGFTCPPLIRTKEEVKLKIKLLEALGDIEIALKLISQNVADENPIDTRYKSLHCQMTALDAEHADYKLIQDYVVNTHASTHQQYTMQVLDVFSVDREEEQKQYNDVGNKMLLWHGSRLTNWMSIFSQGLKIAPPEAPTTGYMFGKGIYFADMSSKSANYCYPSRTNSTGLLLACEVALGQSNDLLTADYHAAELPAGAHSVRGLGKMAPNPSKNATMSDGVIVPLGKQYDTGVVNPDGYTLNYNEYIVYNPNQVKMKYLVKIQFNF